MISERLDGRAAIVTGSTRGIGRGIAARLADAGASVVVHGREPDAAASVAGELDGAVPCAGDIGDPSTVMRLIETATEELGRLDIVVNNAGVAIDNFVTGVTDDRWDATLATNLTGPFQLMREAVRIMKENGGGTICNIVSWAGERGNVGQIAYSASKAGLHALTLTGAKELGKFGIRVNSVSPGVPTDMTGEMEPHLIEAARRRRPLKRDGTAAEVAEAVLFLVSDRALHITGEVLHVDGGNHLS